MIFDTNTSSSEPVSINVINSIFWRKFDFCHLWDTLISSVLQQTEVILIDFKSFGTHLERLDCLSPSWHIFVLMIISLFQFQVGLLLLFTLSSQFSALTAVACCMFCFDYFSVIAKAEKSFYSLPDLPPSRARPELNSGFRNSTTFIKSACLYNKKQDWIMRKNTKKCVNYQCVNLVGVLVIVISVTSMDSD